MDELTLYIGNKNYSSWSLRPWLAMTAGGIPFTEVLIQFDFPAGNPKIKDISPTGRVPLLQHGVVRVWESLAIIEYAAELFPEAGLWPADRQARAVARAYSMEMLSGFRALRNACPMNFHREHRSIDLPDGVMDDVARIEAIWNQAVGASGGPFLFGAFSAADAMFAPVVNRLEVYKLTTDSGALAYMNAVKAHPAFQAWAAAALKEPWIVDEDEV